MSSPLIRVVIVDDDPDVRETISIILDSVSDISVVGLAESARRGVDVVRRLGPAVVLLDIHMPGGDGLAVIPALREASSEPKVLMLTGFHVDDSVHAALAAGASGFLLKGVRPGELPEAVRAVARGETVLAPAVAGAVVDRALLSGASASPRRGQLLEGLSPRDLDLLSTIGRGLSNAEIAAELHISPASAKTFVSRLLDKLGYANRTQLAIHAHRAGLLD